MQQVSHDEEFYDEYEASLRSTPGSGSYVPPGRGLAAVPDDDDEEPWYGQPRGHGAWLQRKSDRPWGTRTAGPRRTNTPGAGAGVNGAGMNGGVGGSMDQPPPPLASEGQRLSDFDEEDFD